MKLPKLTDVARLIETMERHPFTTLLAALLLLAWISRH
jgi:hypothetical protein